MTQIMRTSVTYLTELLTFFLAKRSHRDYMSITGFEANKCVIFDFHLITFKRISKSCP